jgi:hypothetical protein
MHPIKELTFKLSLSLTTAYTLLSGCSSGGDGNVDVSEPIEEGVSQLQFFSRETDNANTFIATTLVDTGRQVLLVGGDSVVAETSAARVLLSSDDDFTFYSANFPQNLDDTEVNFSIDYLPVEAREDRWYPADEAYVDIGPSRYTKLNWTLTPSFPADIEINSPIKGDTFNSIDDRFNINWENTDISGENVQIWAIFHCLKRSLRLYPNNSKITGKAFSIAMQELFDEVGGTDSSDEDLQNTQRFLDIKFFNQYQSYEDSIFFEIGVSPRACDISIHAFTEKTEASDTPFVSGNIFYHSSKTITIHYEPFNR